MQQYIIIVAGGKGLRMGTELPKQFLSLCDRPVLMHTIEVFFRFDPDMRIILVLPETQQAYWKELCNKYTFEICHEVVTGGETRFHSVRNGLALVSENALAGIHDGVRPLVSQRMIADSFRLASEKGAAFPVIPVTDTLRRQTGSGSVIVNRDDYMLVQTPQTFHSEIILKAYSQEYSSAFTDDISVVEALGEYPVFTFEGEKKNLKITTPSDLILAESILKSISDLGH